MASWKGLMEKRFPDLMELCGTDVNRASMLARTRMDDVGRLGRATLNKAFDVLTDIAISIIGTFHQTIANNPDKMVTSNLCLLSGRGDWCYEDLPEVHDFSYDASVTIGNLLYITLWGCELQKTLPGRPKNDQAMIETIDEMVRNKLTQSEPNSNSSIPIAGVGNSLISKRKESDMARIMREKADKDRSKIKENAKCPSKTGVFSFLFEARIICLMTGCSFKVVKELLEGNEQTTCMSVLHSEWVKNNDKDSQFMIDEIDDRNNMFAYARWQEYRRPRAELIKSRLLEDAAVNDTTGITLNVFGSAKRVAAVKKNRDKDAKATAATTAAATSAATAATSAVAGADADADGADGAPHAQPQIPTATLQFPDGWWY
jgi:hypothetical protein